MKIALVGARLLAEALDRGHQVTAIVGDASRLADHASLAAVPADATDPVALARQVAGHDVVISSYNPGRDTTGAATRAIVDGVKRAGVARFLVLGGAGSLKLPNGERVVDQPGFPAEWKAGALATSAAGAGKGERQLPHRQGRAADRQGGREPDLARGLCGRDAG